MDNNNTDLVISKNKNTEIIEYEEEVPQDVKHIEKDYTYSRKIYKNLIERGNVALENMISLADESGHPRAYEVLATLLKNIADTTDKLMVLQETKNRLLSSKPSTQHQNNTTNNNLFIGSTEELQKLIEAKRKEI